MHTTLQTRPQPTITIESPTIVRPKIVKTVLRTLAKRSFCTIATSSVGSRSHSAGVIYVWADDALWIHTSRTSRKGRNIAANDRIGVCVPFRRMPVGPPYTIHFQGSAELIAMDNPTVAPLLASGQLKAITGHGELDMPDGCFIRIRPHGNIHSFGPGARIIDMIRDPLGSGAHSFNYAEATA